MPHPVSSKFGEGALDAESDGVGFAAIRGFIGEFGFCTQPEEAAGEGARMGNGDSKEVSISLEYSPVRVVALGEPVLPGDGKPLLSLGGERRPDVCQLAAPLGPEVDVGDRESSTGSYVSLEENERREEGGYTRSLQKFPSGHFLIRDPSPAIRMIEIFQQISWSQ